MRILCYSIVFLTILSFLAWEYATPYIVNVLASTNFSTQNENMTTNKTGMNETITSIANSTTRTPGEGSLVPINTRPIIITRNDVDWISIAGVFGSAIAGAALGSFLQNFFSNRNTRKREHLADLKEKVAKPLFERITSPDFTIRTVEFKTFDEDKGRPITSENILYHDFMENHYPDIQTSEKEFYDSKVSLDNAEQDLRNKLNSTFRPILEEMRARYTEDENTFNEEWIASLVITIVYSTYDVLVSAIVDRKYDKSFFHIAEDGSKRILYFYPVKDDMIPFKLPSDERRKTTICYI